MKKVVVFAVLFFVSILNGFTLDIEVPDPVFQEKENGVIPVIDNYTLDGTGEKPILPYKNMVFSSKVIKVEILEEEEIILNKKIVKGLPVFRMGDMKKIEPVSSGDTLYPTRKKFCFFNHSTIRRGLKEFPLKFYPVIPVSDNKVVFVKKVRLHFEEKADVLPMRIYAGKSLLILTSDAFLGASKELSRYIDAKKSQGFTVDVATESDYQAGELRGYERAEAIRTWLVSVHKKYRFLLIIADPTPFDGDIPMIVTRPNRGEVEVDYEEAATDVFYGELTEDIDSNGNGVPGERYDEIYLSFELIVGRIPYYNKRYQDADKILARTVKYIYEPSSQAEYRRKILFPTSIAYYPGQDGNSYIPKMDGAYVARYVENNLLPDYFTTKVLVESEGEDPSEYADIEEALTYDSMLNSWNENFGIVYWMGHGMPTYTVRTVWLGDRKNVGYPSSWDMRSEVFVDAAMTRNFKDITNPFVFQGSCLNGKVENGANLGFSTLLNSAVGVVTSTQVAYATIWKDYNLSSQDLFSYGTVFVDALLKNQSPAEIIQSKKEAWSSSSVLLTMKYALNYLGDPSLHMEVFACSDDGDCDDGLFCTGSSVCNQGFCERDMDSLPCQSDKESFCSITSCDEKTRSCVSENRPDGTYCGETTSLCYENMKCESGECINWGITDCSHMDSFCSVGFCDENTGLCEIESVNEGVECDDGLFCTVETKCVEGMCAGEDRDFPEPRPCTKVVCDNNTEDFVTIGDNDQNWEHCVRDDGRKGYCYYGVCEPNEDAGNDNSSGCSVIVL